MHFLKKAEVLFARFVWAALLFFPFFPSFCLLGKTEEKTAQNRKALKPLLLSGASESYLLGPHLELFEDSKREFSELEDVLRPGIQRRFRPSTQENPNFGFSKSRIWARFSVTNRHPSIEEWLFSLNNPITDKITIFVPGRAGKYQKIILGDLHPFRDYAYKTDSHLALLQLPKNRPMTIYFSVESESTLLLPVRLESERAYINRFAHRRLLQGFFIGILLVMFIYNISLFFSIRDRAYLFYVLYLLSFLLASMALYGTAYQYLWPKHIAWNQISFLVLIDLAVIFGLLFSSHFLEIHQSFPKIQKGIYFYIGLLLLILVASLHYPYSVLMPKLNLLSFAFPPFMLGFAIYRLLQGYKPALFFISAFGSIIFASLIFALSRRGYIPSNFWTDHSLQIGSAFEIVLFSLGLSARINSLRREKEDIQEEALKKERELSEAYARFVPSQILKILNKNSITELGLGDATEERMSILFADIRSFTRLSELMSPTDNFKFLSSIFQRFGPSIRAHGGYIDKYIGDAILALFPRRAEDAVRAAIEMHQTIFAYNKHQSAKKKPPLKLGIGINTGKLMLGTLGEEERLEATVISDAVNLASRMEELTKRYHANLIISEHTLVALNNPNKFRFRFLDQVAVRGKRDMVSLYEILDADEPQERDLKLQTLELFEHGMQDYYLDNYTEAIERFKGVLNQNPRDAVAAMYLKRCEKGRKKEVKQM